MAAPSNELLTGLAVKTVLSYVIAILNEDQKQTLMRLAETRAMNFDEIESDSTSKEELRAAAETVNDIIEESGFEGLGINAVAAKAKVSKMLIYRYFNSLDGLIAAYIQQNDYWINFDEELPDQAHLAAFIKQIFKRQIMRLRENYTLKRLYRWELTTDNKFVKELRNKREEKGIWLVEAVSKLSKHPKKEIAAMASIITAAISYLALLEENCPVYNGLKIQQESGWEELEEGINLLVDLWLQKQL